MLPITVLAMVDQYGIGDHALDDSLEDGKFCQRAQRIIHVLESKFVTFLRNGLGRHDW